MLATFPCSYNQAARPFSQDPPRRHLLLMLEWNSEICFLRSAASLFSQLLVWTPARWQRPWPAPWPPQSCPCHQSTCTRC